VGGSTTALFVPSSSGTTGTVIQFVVVFVFCRSVSPPVAEEGHVNNSVLL
jgi:hypothetical protein